MCMHRVGTSGRISSSCHTYEWMNESCYTYKRVTWRIWMRHVIHVNMSATYHNCECIVSWLLSKLFWSLIQSPAIDFCWTVSSFYLALQHTATHCNTLQHTATQAFCRTVSPVVDCVPHNEHCSTLQHIATHCNTLQHTATQDFCWTVSPAIDFVTHNKHLLLLLTRLFATGK